MSYSWLPLLLGLVGVAVTALNGINLRRRGVKAWVLSTGDDAEGFVGRCFLILIVTYVAILAGAAIMPSWRGALLLNMPAFWWLGNGLIALGVLIVALSQREMGLSWRVGIPDEKPALVTTGPFRHSRNPVFLGIMLITAGIAFAIPHTVSWVALAVTYVAISVQIRLEEAFLNRMLGQVYSAYAQKVRRWV
jgi:protein-S-isoprenylcysteine O-methyltransferase Ste14